MGIDALQWAMQKKFDNPVQKLVLIGLCDSEVNGQLFIDRDRLCEFVGVTEITAKSHIKDLKDQGYIYKDGSKWMLSYEPRTIDEPEEELTPVPTQEEFYNSSVDDVFDYWANRYKQARGSRAGPPMKKTRKRTSKITARLREGYTVDQLKEAIDGMTSNDYNVDNGYLDIELCLRNQQKVEQYRAYVTKETARHDDEDYEYVPGG